MTNEADRAAVDYRLHTDPVWHAVVEYGARLGSLGLDWDRHEPPAAIARRAVRHALRDLLAFGLIEIPDDAAERFMAADAQARDAAEEMKASALIRFDPEKAAALLNDLLPPCVLCWHQHTPGIRCGADPLGCECLGAMR